tara:strand:- start:543 stop:1364 length:822 start_codon:yes stop_codon:yes gene_type:complete
MIQAMQEKNKLLIYCLCLDNKLLSKVKDLNYIPVGLGKDNFSMEWLRDNSGDNISHKNPYYGEYSFHYWFWKNEIDKVEDNAWIGFCTYRRFWVNEINKDLNKIPKKVVQSIPDEWNKYDVILGDKINVQGIKLMKTLKRGKKLILQNPKVLLKKNRNIKFQFDFHHGLGVLDKAIELLDDNNRENFKNYVTQNGSYNQGNMFITKSKKLIKDYYKDVFSWLEKCEKIFGYDLEGYNQKRIYAFLAERFLPYWFNKNAKVLEWPIIFEDLNKD